MLRQAGGGAAALAAASAAAAAPAAAAGTSLAGPLQQQQQQQGVAAAAVKPKRRQRKSVRAAEEPAECRPLSQSITAEAAAAASGAPAALRGALRLRNHGEGYVAIELVTVRLLSDTAEHLSAMAACGGADGSSDGGEFPTLPPGGALSCSWAAPLPAGAAVGSYTSVVSSVTLAATGERCEAACAHPLAGAEGEC
ncbi:hypothetical protein Rsub_06864 [Raphidocelis subcapitata]|uniref:Uncharacterized protein n=1 Tax=Raphidocelis subcapitata TaxID=307507 RepID=A0A2V0P9T7_9CHLO|nr:hypothetical protein Rsub_06864 [Raphidocelis subcapitata]|eukprot:GBF93865.1 hypothetical protein Rsub_06864 [Raphidocelis subcapitata]